jgi:hypothetical protein
MIGRRRRHAATTIGLMNRANRQPFSELGDRAAAAVVVGGMDATAAIVGSQNACHFAMS